MPTPSWIASGSSSSRRTSSTVAVSSGTATPRSSSTRATYGSYAPTPRALGLSEAGSLPRLLDQIAVGTGAGLRYDLSFLVVRFDVGIGLHLPYATERRGWYNIPRFKDAIGYHLAIGYPF